MLDHAIGPNVIRELTEGMTDVPREATPTAAGRRSRTSAACAADRVVPHSQIGRPDAADYHGGYDEEEAEGYAVEAPAG